MAVDMNTDLNISQIQQANLASALDKIQSKATTSAVQSSETIFGNGPSVTVTHSSRLDWSTLIDQLNSETSETNAKVAKHKLSNVFATLIARARESGTVSQANLESLDQIDKWTSQLEDVNREIAQKKSQIDTYQRNIEGLQKQIARLDEKIAQETNPAKLETLQQQRDGLAGTLANTQTSLEQLQQKYKSLQKDRDAIENKINTGLALINDESLIRELVEALKLTASDVANFMSELDDKERGDDLEKYLESHNPVRIIQDAIAHHDEEILETIDEKRDIKA